MSKRGTGVPRWTWSVTAPLRPHIGPVRNRRSQGLASSMPDENSKSRVPFFRPASHTNNISIDIYFLV
jgi:hypothetical protein